MQQAVCRYIAHAYPGVMFNSDLSGIRLTMGQSMQVKKLRSSNAFPDLTIYHNNLHYPILFIELKSRDAKLLRKDGALCSDDHLREQNELLHELEAQGYMARFGWGFDKTQALIDWYMDNERDPNEPPVPKYYHHEKTITKTQKQINF